MMLQKQATMINWKTWAAKHECEELKEGAWLEPVQALPRRNTDEAPQCTEEAGLGRRLGAEKRVRTLGGRMERSVGAVTKKKAWKNIGCTTVRCGGKLGRNPRRIGEIGAEGQNVEED